MTCEVVITSIASRFMQNGVVENMIQRKNKTLNTPKKLHVHLWAKSIHSLKGTYLQASTSLVHGLELLKRF